MRPTYAPRDSGFSVADMLAANARFYACADRTWPVQPKMSLPGASGSSKRVLAKYVTTTIWGGVLGGQQANCGRSHSKRRPHRSGCVHLIIQTAVATAAVRLGHHVFTASQTMQGDS
jgi:hypothetical protein